MACGGEDRVSVSVDEEEDRGGENPGFARPDEPAFLVRARAI